MSTPSPMDIAAAPTILLGNREWPVPLLVPRQQRIIIPRIMKLGVNLDPTSITTEQYDDLLVIVHTAILRISPEVTYDEFLNMEISLPQLMKAMDVIAMQSGVLGKKGTPLPGEQEAGSPRTGT